MLHIINPRRPFHWGMIVGFLAVCIYLSHIEKSKAQDYVHGYYEDGNTILQKCLKLGSANYSFCQGYVTGIADSMKNSVEYKNKLCMPNGVTVGQLVDIAVNFLRQQASVREYNAYSLVGASFLSSFPCR